MPTRDVGNQKIAANRVQQWDSDKVWLIQAKKNSNLLHLLESNWWPTAIGLVCLVVLIWLVVRLISRVTEDADPAEVAREMLSSINELHREGDLTPDEYRSIKGQLVRRLQQPDDVRKSAAGKSVAADIVEHEDPTTVELESMKSPAQPARTDKTTKSEDIPTPEADNEPNHRDQPSS